MELGFPAKETLANSWYHIYGRKRRLRHRSHYLFPAISRSVTAKCAAQAGTLMVAEQSTGGRWPLGTVRPEQTSQRRNCGRAFQKRRGYLFCRARTHRIGKVATRPCFCSVKKSWHVLIAKRMIFPILLPQDQLGPTIKRHSLSSRGPKNLV